MMFKLLTAGSEVAFTPIFTFIASTAFSIQWCEWLSQNISFKFSASGNLINHEVTNNDAFPYAFQLRYDELRWNLTCQGIRTFHGVLQGEHLNIPHSYSTNCSSWGVMDGHEGGHRLKWDIGWQWRGSMQWNRRLGDPEDGYNNINPRE
jgi:hypothetical protein